ncbi:MAG: NADAR family protein [Oscillospiraceae bacterium]|nr:NADAR family protein [Oscillospiraceae bacterium]
MKIAEFRNETFFLSNFYESPVTYGGITYGSNEAAFQAQKCLTEGEKAAFAPLRPGEAKKKGRRVKLRPDWEQVKVGIMQEIVRAKFTQNEELRALLLATGDAVLEEGNTWNDTFWGVHLKTGQGQNHLGRILMQVREELRAAET